MNRLELIIAGTLFVLMAASAHAEVNRPPEPPVCDCMAVAAQAKAGIAANAALTMAVAGVNGGKGLAVGVGLAEYGGDMGAAIGGVMDLGNGITLNAGVLLPEGHRVSPAIGMTWNF